MTTSMTQAQHDMVDVFERHVNAELANGPEGARKILELAGAAEKH